MGDTATRTTPIPPQGLSAPPGHHDDMAVARELYRPSSGGHRWIGLGMAVLAVLGGTTVAVLADGSDAAEADDATGMVSALTPSTRTRTTEQPVISAPAVVPGYRAVVAPDSDAAYDVPADWTIAPPDRSGGFGKPPNTIGGKGYASEGKDYCPGSTRTVAFLTGSPTTDTTAAALEVGARAARIAYLADPTRAAALPRRHPARHLRRNPRPHPRPGPRLRPHLLHLHLRHPRRHRQPRHGDRRRHRRRQGRRPRHRQAHLHQHPPL
ncbi:hypothetical protein [Nocardia farcinica]|uniref:hypothetical protein n=1 Tax=Nocardia farcinica TaxID=37329 RepID=UPI0011C02D70|nr:hypothetical protein [Nocardia farcinica]